METVTSLAPLRRDHSGWMNAPHLCLPNYDCSMSSGYATHTRSIDYGSEEEAAGMYLQQSVTYDMLTEKGLQVHEGTGTETFTSKSAR